MSRQRFTATIQVYVYSDDNEVDFEKAKIQAYNKANKVCEIVNKYRITCDAEISELQSTPFASTNIKKIDISDLKSKIEN